MAPGVDAAESHTTPPRAAANNANGDHVQPADTVAATMDVHSGRSLPPTTMNREKRIRVCVRVRPFAKNEAIRTGGKAAWTWHGNTIYQQIFPAQAPTRKARTDSGANVTSSANAASNAHLPSSYSVDHLYGPTANTSQLYDDAVRDSIAAAVEGYHSSVFVYGQTGTGKTHTMLGTRAEPGLIQLAVEDIFGLIARHGESEFLLRFSYLEIYNERVHDLLAGGVRKDVKIYEVARQDAENDGTDSNTPNDIVVKGLDEQVVVSVEQVIALVEAGNVHRHTATTDANDNSSRSHTIFRLVIESQAKGGSTGVARSATLNLIDLAGSESVRLANTSGNHVEEGRHINRSLLTLGHIIWKLSRGGRSSSGKSSNDLMHLPYRNSKLTRILQPALGGKAQITIVCTVAPSVECLAETHNTLKFATRARRVKSRLAINEATGESALLKKYRTRMKELQDEWDELERRKSNATNGSNDVAAIETLQFELQFAIENINRVILNSSHRHGTTLANGKEGPSDSSGQDSNNDEVEGEDDDDATDDEFKESLVIKPSQSFKQRFMLTAGEPESATAATIQRRNLTVLSDDSARSLQSIAQRRASLTTVLKTKYINELSQFEEDEDAYRETALSALSAPLHNPTHRELLREFVRGLEIAEAEHETRLSQIHELELENHHLRELLRERDEELAAMRARIA